MPLTSAPEWKGQSLAGKRIVLTLEQGYGDSLMFARFLPQLFALGAEIIVATDARFLSRLYEREGFQTVHMRLDHPLPPCDFWAPLGSLPYRLGSPPPSDPVWLTLPHSGGDGIGVVVKGRPGAWNSSARDLGPCEAEALLGLGVDLSPEATGARDFLDTAQIIAGLDTVVTVDTAVAHLAGSMGKRLMVLLPFREFDWRWNDGVRCDWYPAATLLRQEAPGDWRGVLNRLPALLGIAA